MLILILDPVRLTGELQFHLQNLKEISVTDSFLGLNVESRKCQNIETLNDCKTRLYIENMKQTCGCLPVSHIMSEKVHYKSTYVDYIGILDKDILCSKKEEITCSKTLEAPNTTSCLRSNQ